MDSDKKKLSVEDELYLLYDEQYEYASLLKRRESYLYDQYKECQYENDKEVKSLKRKLDKMASDVKEKNQTSGYSGSN